MAISLLPIFWKSYLLPVRVLRCICNFQKGDGHAPGSHPEPLLLPASATHTQTPGVSVSHYPDPSHPTLAFAVCSCSLLQSWRSSATFLLWPGLLPMALCLAKVQLLNPGHWCSQSPLGHHSLPPCHLQMGVPKLAPWASGSLIATPVSLHPQRLFFKQRTHATRAAAVGRIPVTWTSNPGALRKETQVHTDSILQA